MPQALGDHCEAILPSWRILRRLATPPPFLAIRNAKVISLSIFYVAPSLFCAVLLVLEPSGGHLFGRRGGVLIHIHPTLSPRTEPKPTPVIFPQTLPPGFAALAERHPRVPSPDARRLVPQVRSMCQFCSPPCEGGMGAWRHQACAFGVAMLTFPPHVGGARQPGHAKRTCGTRRGGGHP